MSGLDFDPTPNDTTDIEKQIAEVKKKIRGNRGAEEELRKLEQQVKRRPVDWDSFW